MGVKIDWVDPKKFSYALFESDVNKFCKQNRMTQEDISQKVIVRSHSYLNDGIRKRKLPYNCFKAVAEYIGQDMTRYKIVEKPPIEKEAVIPEATLDVDGWSLKLLVNEDFGVVRCMLNHGTETVAIGSCDSELRNGTEVIKAITVAMNRLTSKLIPGQQSPNPPKPEPPKQEAPKPEPKPEPPKDETPKKPEEVGRKSFKDWIMQYYDSHSDVGRLARFIDEHYNEFPTWGEVKMQRFLQLTVGGKAHLSTFNAYFSHYRAMQRREEQSNSDKLKNGVVKWV